MADLTKVDSFQYPAAHLGHLTEKQQTALNDFKQICEKQGYYFPAGAEGRSANSHDDETLLRYLRARKFSPQEAFQQFKDTEDWRKENHLEELYDTINITEYDESRRLYPQWTGRRDKRGIPLYIFEVAPLNSKAINEYQNSLSKSPAVAHKASKVPNKMLRLFALYENLTRFVLPLCSAIKDRPHPETPISQSNNIVDISGVGLKQFWNLKSHMQDASQLATAHYPETLDRIFIIGAPSFFPTVWSWIKRWFDPITVSKIFILSQADMKPTLEKYIDVENIPKRYGGKLDFDWGMMPLLEPAIVEALSWKGETAADVQKGQRTIPTGPIKWRQRSNGALDAVAVGSENGKKRDRAFASINTAFKDMHGISRTNTTIDWTQEKVQATSGSATQPTEEGDPNLGAELEGAEGNSGTATPQPGFAMATGHGTANNSASIPAQPVDDGNTILSPSNTQPRTGTSATKQEQQDHTHASGTLDEGTPHTIDYGQGDKAQTVETSTVGQAPKDVKANLPDAEEPAAPSYLQQAQDLAASAAGAATAAVSSVTGAVGGLTLGSGEKKEEKPVKKAEDGRIDQVKDGNIEGLLRAQYASKTA